MRSSDLWLYQTDTTKVSNVSQMLGETRTLRAMMYLDMTRLWGGDIPFRTWGSQADEDYAMPATQRHLIWEWLIEDLIAAEPTMQYASDIQYGVERAAREFCQGLIALIAMNRGGWYLRPWDGNEPAGVQGDPEVGYMYRHEDYLNYYRIARQYAQKVIEDGRHSLTYSYEKLWYEISNDRYATGDDILFAIPLRGGEYCYWAGLPVETGTHPYGQCTGGMSSSIIYMVSFDSLDVRRDITCVPYKYTASLNQEPLSNLTSTIGTMQNGKWNRLQIESPLGSESTKNSGIDYIFMRYADVLLLFAEAENELNGPTDSAKMALKTVRQRAFASQHWPEKVEAFVNGLNTKEEFFQSIMDERKWEFGGEQIRRFDLARWNKYGQALYDTYFEFVGWGQYVAGVGGNQYADRVREKIWWRPVADPENPGRTLAEFWGLSKQEYVRPQETYDEWTEITIVSNWWRDTNEPGEQAHSYIRGAYAGYINPSNENTVDPNIDPVRYLLPIPSSAIADHKGLLKNYYGY
ncbi:MAG: RagB/SusD family nutrient uptake outer membrane protein [Rikenellaceae bacterium]|nr:RagB/SusD family nutrient uptake outer membrane protein [Rikenellaceae bacterium]